MPATLIRPSPGYRIALSWEAILNCTGRPGVALSDVNEAGVPMGAHRVATLPSPADPMWAKNEYDPCPVCNGSGEECHLGVSLGVGDITEGDWWMEPCSRCAGAGEVRVPARYIGEFDPSHRRNLYSWLMRRAPTLAGYHVYTWHRSPFGMDDGMEHFAEEAERDLARDPWGWLAAKPFLLALGALLLGDGNGATVGAWERRAGQERQPERALGDFPEMSRVELAMTAATMRLHSLDLGLQ